MGLACSLWVHAEKAFSDGGMVELDLATLHFHRFASIQGAALSTSSSPILEMEEATPSLSLSLMYSAFPGTEVASFPIADASSA